MKLLWIVFCISTTALAAENTKEDVVVSPPEFGDPQKLMRGMVYIPKERVTVVTEGSDSEPFQVELPGFYMDRDLITNEEYRLFLDATGRPKPAAWVNDMIPQGEENQPIVNVTHDDAAAYASWIGKRLPKQAEFQRALRRFPSLRLRVTYDEWTDTFANPNASPKQYIVIGGPPLLGDEDNEETGFRLASD